MEHFLYFIHNGNIWCYKIRALVMTNIVLRDKNERQLKSFITKKFNFYVFKCADN